VGTPLDYRRYEPGGAGSSYLLKDSVEGAQTEGELTGKPPKESPFGLSVRQGFVYERVPHIQLGDIARNAEIDIVWEKWQSILGPLLDQPNEELDERWDEWQVPRKASEGLARRRQGSA
jgi:adenine-specific DNA-methyltransferase